VHIDLSRHTPTDPQASRPEPRDGARHAEGAVAVRAGPDTFTLDAAGAPWIERLGVPAPDILAPGTRSWTEHRPWLAILAAAIAVGIALDASGAARGMMAPVLDVSHYVLALLLVPWLAAVSLLGRRVRHRRPWRELWRAARRAELADARLVDFAVVIVGMRAMLMTAIAYKVAMPTVRPFAYDTTLMMLDRSLHAGRLPHEWLSLGDGSLRALDALYASWYPMLGVWVMWMAVRPDAPDRRRALLAMVLLWIVVGGGVAWLGSSAGPCFYNLVHPNGDGAAYALQLERLRALGLVATGIQDQLWRAHVHAPTDLLAGIAAFPSLHVAVPALLALSLPRLRWPLIVLTASTMIGSVVLLWHYAVDGYAGVLGALLCWWAAGRIVAAGTESGRS